VFEIKYSPEASNDLDRIGDYISKDLQNPTAALNTVNAIQDRIDKLKKFPNTGTLLSSIYEDIDLDDYRFVICLNYLAFYRVVGKKVFIDRIFHEKQDYISILLGSKS